MHLLTKVEFRELAVLACLALFLWGDTVLAQIQYSDTEFDVANDWTVFGPYNDPPDAQNSAFSAQQMSGSNPYMEVTHARGTVSSGMVGTWGAVINNTLVWDPSESADGKLGKIDMTLFIEGGGAWSLAVKQGEFVWMAVGRRAVLNVSDPVTIEIEDMVEEHFIPLPGSEFVVDNQPPNPDFSANAPPISFGVGVGFSCPETSNCTVTRTVHIKIDDLHITAYPSVPFTAGHNGNWWNGLARSGEGVQAEISRGGDDSLIFVATVYSYNDMGQQIFLIAVGPVDDDTATVDVYITDGGAWGDAFDPDDIVETQWGTGTFRSCGCDNMVMTLRPNEEYKAQGFTDLFFYDLIPLTTRAIPCPYEDFN